MHAIGTYAHASASTHTPCNVSPHPKTLGRMFGISDAILGLTVLAWGNSIGDFVSNLTVAKQGTR